VVPRGGPVDEQCQRLQFSLDASAGNLITIADGRSTFTFFASDVSSSNPILIPAYGVAVTDDLDARTYCRDREGRARPRMQTKLERIASDPEESFENAARASRNVTCQTWLGLGRDIRIFAVSDRLDWVETRLHGKQTRTMPF